MRNFVLALVFGFLLNNGFGQQIPLDKVVPLEQLSDYLTPAARLQIAQDQQITQELLAQYLRDKFSERYFYNWKTFDSRFEHYNEIYPENKESHLSRAADHMGKFAASPQWVLPSNYLNGTPVNAYALRHLARQHKMVDIAFLYHYSNQDATYLNYFTSQMQSLNNALVKGDYEKIEDGNGVYEVFRSGYRIINWLKIHSMFLGEVDYSDQDQLRTIATLLQHGAHLFERNAEFRPGNHQTRGMSALAVISILLRDFQGTELWYDRAITRLNEHLDKEINPDGFQFERSVHYHMSDINNYYYVYQLAKLNNIEVDKAWEENLRNLFTTLVKIAYPDRSAPVLQDDTEIPWGEKNDISGAMTLGYLLFEDPEFGYFASDKVDERMYWFLNQPQVALLGSIQRKRPSFGSIALADTHYYIMREGWNPNDRMMVVSSGLDDQKPDHQHGDMLGIQAMANGKVILPNYQVRYSLPDFELFKNSMVKNVALVDDQLQGIQWTSNKGGSGFGKFGKLPNPRTLVWNSNNALDVFVGSHDGFNDIGVNYSRQVIYIKDDFWIVKDNFKSKEPHTYKQIWQGHYTSENAPNLLRETFDNGTGCDIFQLVAADEISTSGKRGKAWSVVSKKSNDSFSFVTVIYPYNRYDKRIDEIADTKNINGWKINNSDWETEGTNAISLSNNRKWLFFSVQKLSMENVVMEFSETADVYVELKENQIHVQSVSGNEVLISASGVKELSINDKKAEVAVKLAPGAILKGILQEVQVRN